MAESENGQVRVDAEELVDVGAKLLKLWRDVVPVPIPLEFVCPEAFAETLKFYHPSFPGLPKDGIETAWAGMRWADAGKPLFRLTHGLTASLVLTDCRAVRTDEIAMPFSAFRVGFPQPNAVITAKWRSEPIIDLLVVTSKRVQRPAYERAIAQMMQSTNAAQATFNALSAVVTHQRDAVPAEMVGMLRTPTANRIMILTPFSKFETIGEWMGHIADDLVPHGPGVAHSIITVLRVLINLLLYLSSTKGEPLDRYADSKHVEGRPRTLTVGRAVKLPGHLMQAARALTQDGEAQTSWKLQSRFVVMGHWKMQPCGPGRTERKRIHVESYWKGPTGAEAIARVYEVESIKEHPESH